MSLTASELLSASFQYIAALSPFALVFTAVYMGDELVRLVKKAASTAYRSRSW